MKRQYAEMIERWVMGEHFEQQDPYIDSDETMFIWRENEWDNTVEWDGTSGCVTYHCEEFEIDNFPLETFPFIDGDWLHFTGNGQDLAIKLE